MCRFVRMFFGFFFFCWFVSSSFFFEKNKDVGMFLFL